MNLREFPLEPEKFYHIYNRGVNGENIFKEARNYNYFLEKYTHYIFPIADTYVYCLLKNHFHVLIKVKNEDILNNYVKVQNFDIVKQKHTKGLHDADYIVSKQFGRLISSYTQSVNKEYNRTGPLLESPFKSIEVTTEEYITELIRYIHYNPQKHGFIKDFREYPYSSYLGHITDKPTKLMRNEVIDWFGGENEYIKFHAEAAKETSITNYLLEH